MKRRKRKRACEPKELRWDLVRLINEANNHFPARPLPRSAIQAFLKGGWTFYSSDPFLAWALRLEEHKEYWLNKWGYK